MIEERIPGKPVDFDRLIEEASEVYAGAMQTRYFAIAALTGMKTDQSELRRLGYDIEVIWRDRTVSPVQEYPKMFYHPTHGELTVGSEEEAKNLSPGWQDKPLGWKEKEQREEVPEVPESAPPPPVPVDIANYVSQHKETAGTFETISEPTPHA